MPWYQLEVVYIPGPQYRGAGRPAHEIATDEQADALELLTRYAWEGDTEELLQTTYILRDMADLAVVAVAYFVAGDNPDRPDLHVMHDGEFRVYAYQESNREAYTARLVSVCPARKRIST